ncbi:hypothetical protein SAMN05216428_12311 [Nitrosospira sp. Nsp11]|uniref:hypothetical protein n=1 Tax=Nitrosospira sp. Nsp11 TaxID=1855338 RepID=UPI0009187770|nr:hypothetical protein [Nitrosospira sp. Nsp11]SHM30389.1 hypothetical protein SAMN05216428_12311 [Nitrosospira sp. Nsp11]
MGTSVFDFKTAFDVKETVKKLNEISSTNDAYRWLNPIINTTLDEYVASELNGDPPVKLAYNPCRVEENLSEAARLLDICLGRRTEIQQLEVQAILAALELQLADQLQPFDLEVGQATFMAAQKQAYPDIAGKTDAVDARNEVLSAARKVKLDLHNKQGSSLNYGERITFLRNLYVNNIRLAYERLHAARIGLSSSFGISLQEIPKWNASANTLDLLTYWLRQAITVVERSDRYEQIYTRFLLLSNLVVGGVPAVVTALRSPGDSNLRFNLTEQNLLGFDLPNGGAVRMIGLGASMLFEGDFVTIHRTMNDLEKFPAAISRLGMLSEWRRRIQSTKTFTVSIELPEQRANLADLAPTESAWPLERIILSGVSGWTERTVQEAMNLTVSKQFTNANPLGEWNMSISNEVISIMGQEVRGNLSDGLGKDFDVPSNAMALFNVLVGVQVAVRLR